MKLVSLDLSELPATLDAWRNMWGAVGRFEKGRAWAYGDLFLKGRDFLELQDEQFYTFAETAARILKIVPLTGIEPKTLMNWAMVANKFPPKARFPDLPWTLHRELVDLPLAEATKWLKRAQAEDWAVEDLRQHRAESTGARVAGPPLAAFVPRKAVADQVRWFRLQFEDTPLEDWSKERRAALKREYQPLLDILKSL